MTPNAKRVAAYQKRQSEKVARMKAALEDALSLLTGDLSGSSQVAGVVRDIREALGLAPTDGRGEG